jgi:RHS repeat-associated protein
MIDPVGRTFSYVYADNGIDLLEVRQTRDGQNELLLKRTYKAQHPHLPDTSTDAAGQTTTYTYNKFGQVETVRNAKNETTTYIYDDTGHVRSIEGPLPGASITFTYDSVSRVRTRTDESGYTLTFDYDDLDRITTITYPDKTFDQFTFKRLDLSVIRDRAERETTFEYNSIRQMTKRVDPLDRVTLFEWCKCGALRSVTDPMGRTTSWRHDIQGRVKCKEYPDGSKVTYLYENTISRLRQRIDEKLQVTQYNYNRDDTVSRITYNHATVDTPSVAFAYDAHYNRLSSMKDGTGTTVYDYIPITRLPSLGAGQLASVDGPLPDDTITFEYDELGRRVSTAINGVASSITHDAAGRVISSTNALGVFRYTYDGNSFRKASQSHPNGHTFEFRYADILQDLHLQRITNKLENTPISEFIYCSDVPRRRITSWSQQSGEQPPSIYSFGYDDADQLVSASLSDGGNVKAFGYSYDSASNRLTEQIDATTRQFSYNALNELTSVEGDASPDATYQWDAEHRLISVISGNQNTEFTYDGVGRRVGIRLLVNGDEVSNRRFIWCDNDICEERTPAGIVSKRFFLQGIKVESGAMAGKYFYTRDHLSSVRELIDEVGNVRARFNYDPYGARSRISGTLDVDFGFTGHFYHVETGLDLTWFRAYDPKLGRWLSRDSFPNAEMLIGPYLYAYAGNNPVNFVDLTGQLYGSVFGFIVTFYAVGPLALGLTIGGLGLLSALHPGQASGPTSGTGPSGSGGGLNPAPAPGEDLAPGDSGGGLPGYRKPSPRPYYPPDPPDPPGSRCKWVVPFLEKVKCCFRELKLPPPGEKCFLTPEQKKRLDECTKQ